MPSKQLSVAGVRCFGYLEDREVMLESATDKFLLGAVTFAADLEREKAQQRTYDAMARKAKAGHVTGGRIFGYDNLDVERRERPAIARRAADQRDGGRGHPADFPVIGGGRDGVKAIAKILNAEGACPRGRNAGARSPGRRRLSGKCSIANCIAGKSCGRKRAKRDKSGQEATDRQAGDRLDSPARACTPHRQR